MVDIDNYSLLVTKLITMKMSFSKMSDFTVLNVFYHGDISGLKEKFLEEDVIHRYGTYINLTVSHHLRPSQMTDIIGTNSVSGTGQKCHHPASFIHCSLPNHATMDLDTLHKYYLISLLTDHKLW